MTMDSSTPGSTPPPSWTPDPVPAPPPSWTPDSVPAPPANPVPFTPPTSFAPAPLVAKTVAKNRASTGTALLLVGALVAIGGVAFAVGRVTAPAAATTPAAGGFGGAGRGTGEGGTGGFGGAGGAGGFGGGRGGAGVNITGTVVSIDGSSIQLKLANGTTETLNLASTVTYRDSTTGTAADVAPGATVQISLALGAGAGGPTASGQPRPSGGFGGLGNATVGTITVVK
jgi:hypothetical protein